MNFKPNCAHGYTIQRYVEKYDDWYGETTHEWEDHHVSYLKDIDLHRYTCTKCNQIFYYSGAAKEYYETGVDRKGLFK